MGKALELITGFATAPDSAQVDLTMAAGNTRTIRNFTDGSLTTLLSMWADVQTAGILRVRSPSLHDNVQGLRVRTVVSNPLPLLPMAPIQPLIAQDTLQIDISGSSTAEDIETACLLVYYEDLDGIDARLSMTEDILPRIKSIAAVENTLAMGTGGGYSGEEALNAEFDLLRANTDYALIGYQVSAECAAVRWRGTDTGNLGVGGPGTEIDKMITANWFLDLSTKTGLPLVPVINSSNAGAVLIDGVQDENGTDVTVTTFLAELNP